MATRHLRARTCALLLAVMLVAGGLSSSGCYGQFALTRKLHSWNGSLGEKWVQTLAFWGLVIVPVYSVAALGDALIFNVIEFWGGKNPIDSARSEGASRLAKSIELEHRGARFRLDQTGPQRFELRRDGQLVARGSASAAGLVLTDLQGKRVRYLSAETLAAWRQQLL